MIGEKLLRGLLANGGVAYRRRHGGAGMGDSPSGTASDGSDRTGVGDHWAIAARYGSLTLQDLTAGLDDRQAIGRDIEHRGQTHSSLR
jgi:hypothetical protein